MTLIELVEAVIVNTNHPELQKETQLAVQRSTIKMHQLDFFSLDLTQGQIKFAPTINPRIDLALLGKGMRRLASVTGITQQGGFTPLEKLDLLSAMETKGQVGYTVVGGSLVIQSGGVPLSAIIFTYYTNPVTDLARYNSWIANNHPFAIIDDASAAVLASVGANERAGYFANLVGSKLPKPSGHVAEILANNDFGYVSQE